MNTLDITTDFADALRANHTEAVNEILTRHPELANSADERGFPPLVMAAYYDGAETVKVLLDAGADINARDRSGNTALMGATFKGYERTAGLLISNGADVNARNYNGATALIFTATFRQTEIAKQLIKAGADTQLSDANGNSPADHARIQGLDATIYS